MEKHDLRKYMQFDTEMQSATWDDITHRWRITCSTGEKVSARYLVNSLGLLSKVHYPDIPGLSLFAGELVHTAKWPEDLNLGGKKVGIIGNGSTGIQVMTAIAPIVGSLKTFQRHPQYSVSSGQGPVPAGYREKINANYDQIWDNVWSSMVGFGVPESQHRTMDATPEERQKAFQEVWDQGNGFRFMFSAFGDLTTSQEANEEACKFIRSKIDEIIIDKRKADTLKPKDLYARRPLCDTGYYHIFNRENVDVIDLQATPIKQIIPHGIETSDGAVHELDVLIVATGFDAIEGNYMRVNITGRDRTIQEHWANGPTAFGGIACAGFPNMFLVAGPQGPFANFPPVIESEINFIMSCIEHAEGKIVTGKDRVSNGNATTNGSTVHTNGHASLCKEPIIMEVSEDAERGWIELCDKLVEGSLFTTTASWIFGKNIPGRKASTNFYFGGLKNYLEWVNKQISDGFPAFVRG